jgi:hypothetical protein
MSQPRLIDKEQKNHHHAIHPRAKEPISYSNKWAIQLDLRKMPPPSKENIIK